MAEIVKDEVLEAIRRGYSELQNASEDEILEYFQAKDVESLSGDISNIKGILFEQEYARDLQENGVDARLFEETNHPISDIGIFEDGIMVEELQLKATSNPSYIEETLNEMPEDVTVVATSEVASNFEDEVIDSGISDAVLEEAIEEVIMPISGISILGWFFGIF
jgi:hypothetical protein